MVGSVCFGVLFGIYDRKLLFVALGSGGGWIVYLLCVHTGYGKFIGLLAASLFVAALSELLARILKTPVILLLVPMLIPEIPGGDLYYTMYYLVQEHYPEFGIYSKQVLMEAGAIALGIILVSCIIRFLQSCQAIIDKRLRVI